MSIWGPLAERYTTKQPRKVLALDGGWIRGVTTLEILKEIERKLKAKLGKQDFCFAHYFDYIGSTSTRAIIAPGLSLGFSVDKLLDFYTNKGKDRFNKNFIIKRWKAFYNSEPLELTLKETFGEGTSINLASGNFKSLLLVVRMNRTTDSPWPISRECSLKFKYRLIIPLSFFLKNVKV